SQEDTTRDQGQYLQYDRARTVGTGGNVREREPARSALSIHQAWTWRRFDNPVFPDSGQGLALELGLGVTLDGTRRPFLRTQTRWRTFWPLGDPLPPAAAAVGEARARPAASQPGTRLGRLALRLEGGAVAARQDA